MRGSSSSLIASLSVLLQVQLLASLDQQEAASLAKSLLFYAKLGPGQLDLFQAVSQPAAYALCMRCLHAASNLQSVAAAMQHVAVR